MSDKFFIGSDLVSFFDNGKYKPVSRVTLKLDSENVVTSGDDTGMELIADCPFATQQMADDLLSKYIGYSYHAFEAGSVNIDPAAELGDGMTAEGRYSIISRSVDNGNGYPTLSAPGEAELEEEYPAAGPMTQEFNRKIAQTNSRITKTAEEILLEITGLDRKYTALAVTLDGVTVTDETGETLIKGSSIQTDTLYVNAANINGTLTASQIELSGSITWSDLDSNVKNIIYSQGTALPSYIKSTYIDSTTIKSPTIEADVFNVLPSSDTDADGSYNIYGMYGNSMFHFFTIAYSGLDVPPKVRLYSPSHAQIELGVNADGIVSSKASELYIGGNIHFSGTVVDWGGNAPAAVFA